MKTISNLTSQEHMKIIKRRLSSKKIINIRKIANAVELNACISFIDKDGIDISVTLYIDVCVYWGFSKTECRGVLESLLFIIDLCKSKMDADAEVEYHKPDPIADVLHTVREEV